MASEADMLAALRANPHDDAARLVYADWLIERGDERGELLMLEHADRTSELELASQLRLLKLAAAHGFAWFEPELPPIDWDGGGAHPVQYEGSRHDSTYVVRYNRRNLSLSVQGITYELDHRIVEDGYWSDAETYTLLRLFGEAVQRGSLDRLYLPSAWGMTAHASHMVKRDHARWCERWDRYLVQTGARVDRPQRTGPLTGSPGTR